MKIVVISFQQHVAKGKKMSKWPQYTQIYKEKRDKSMIHNKYTRIGNKKLNQLKWRNSETITTTSDFFNAILHRPLWQNPTEFPRLCRYVLNAKILMFTNPYKITETSLHPRLHVLQQFVNSINRLMNVVTETSQTEIGLVFKLLARCT